MRLKDYQNKKRVTDFKIRLDDIEAGWETVTISFNETQIVFDASHIGDEPLSTLIEAIDALDEEYISGSGISQYFINWCSEPGRLLMELCHNLSDNQLSVKIKVSKSDDINDESAKEWNLVLDYTLFRQAVIDIVAGTLKVYGICGFNQNWSNDYDILPIKSLLNVLGAEKAYFDRDIRSFRSDLTREIATLSSIISYTKKL